LGSADFRLMVCPESTLLRRTQGKSLWRDGGRVQEFLECWAGIQHDGRKRTVVGESPMLQRTYPIKPAPIALRDNGRKRAHSLPGAAKELFLRLMRWLNRLVEAGGPLS
jgi:hypothetical protein